MDANIPRYQKELEKLRLFQLARALTLIANGSAKQKHTFIETFSLDGLLNLVESSMYTESLTIAKKLFTLGYRINHVDSTAWINWAVPNTLTDSHLSLTSQDPTFVAVIGDESAVIELLYEVILQHPEVGTEAERQLVQNRVPFAGEEVVNFSFSNLLTFSEEERAHTLLSGNPDLYELFFAS